MGFVIADKWSWTLTATAATTVRTAMLAGAVGLAGRAVASLGAGFTVAADTTGAAAAVIPAFFAQAVGNASFCAGPLGIAGLPKGTATATATTTVRAALLTAAVGHAARYAMAGQVAVLTVRTGAARATAAVVSALLPGTTGMAIRAAMPLGVAHQPRRARTTGSAAAIRTALLAGAIGLAISGTMALERTIGIDRTGPAGTTTAIRTALLSGAVGSTGLFAMTVGAEEVIGALPARSAAAIRTALLAVTVRLADLLFTGPVVAFPTRSAGPAGPATAIITALQTRAIRLAPASINAQALLAGLLRGAGPARPPTAIPAACLADTVGNTCATTAAVERDNFFDTNLIPLGFAAECVLVADAFLNRRIIASRTFVNLAARAQRWTFAAIRGTGRAGFAASAVAIAAYRTTATTGAAVEGYDFLDTDGIPFLGTAPGIFIADTSCDFGIVAGWSSMRITTPGTGTLPTIFRAHQAIFDAVTFPIAANWPRAITSATAKTGHSVHTHLVPHIFAAE